jgi:ribonuclease VapC
VIFVDASAIIAILTHEPEAESFEDLLDAARAPITSAIALYEATLGICRKKSASVEQVEEDIRGFLERARIEVIPITAKDAETALSAFSRYGKGRGHPAQLNMGDCFAYAVTKNHRRALLFKRDDFDKTDIRSASRAR